jgi:hypothetical protein
VTVGTRQLSRFYPKANSHAADGRDYQPQLVGQAKSQHSDDTCRKRSGHAWPIAQRRHDERDEREGYGEIE